MGIKMCSFGMCMRVHEEEEGVKLKMEEELKEMLPPEELVHE